MPASSTTPAGARPRLAFTAVLSRSLRLAVILVIVACGLILVRTYRSMLHELPAATESNVAGRGPTSVVEGGRGSRMDMEKLADVFLRPGAWSLGDSDWTLALVDLDGAGADARLQSLGRSPTVQAKPSVLEMKLLDWLRHVRPVVVNDCRVYNAMARSVRVRAVTEKRKTEERLRLVQVVWKHSGTARLLEVSPAVSGTQAPNDGHLLPLPSGVASLARRWDESGRLSCEMVGPASVKDCLEKWWAAGWMAAKDDETGKPFSLVVLRRGGCVIHLCPVGAGSPGSPSYLLLMAQPAEL